MTNEELKALCYKIIDLIDYEEHISKLHNCNTCAAKRDCPKAPRLGGVDKDKLLCMGTGRRIYRMRIDLPGCNIKTCRYCFDCNCTDPKRYEQCDYGIMKEKYEYHYDHTDCIWYPNGSKMSSCAQYRDGWNDAMQYIFMDGEGYKPFCRGK